MEEMEEMDGKWTGQADFVAYINDYRVILIG